MSGPRKRQLQVVVGNVLTGDEVDIEVDLEWPVDDFVRVVLARAAKEPPLEGFEWIVKNRRSGAIYNDLAHGMSVVSADTKSGDRVLAIWRPVNQKGIREPTARQRYDARASKPTKRVSITSDDVEARKGTTSKPSIFLLDLNEDAVASFGDWVVAFTDQGEALYSILYQRGYKAIEISESCLLREIGVRIRVGHTEFEVDPYDGSRFAAMLMVAVSDVLKRSSEGQLQHGIVQAGEYEVEIGNDGMSWRDSEGSELLLAPHSSVIQLQFKGGQSLTF